MIDIFDDLTKPVPFILILDFPGVVWLTPLSPIIWLNVKLFWSVEDI